MLSTSKCFRKNPRVSFSRELLVRDYKDYVMGGWKIGIGQIEALDIRILDDRRADFFKEMKKLKSHSTQENQIQWTQTDAIS